MEQLTSTEMFACRCGQRARTDDEPVSVYVEMDQAADGHRCTELRSRTRAAGRRGFVRRPGVVEQLLAAAAGAQGRHRPGVLPHPGPGDSAPVLTWSQFVLAMTVTGLQRTRSSTQGRGRSAPPKG